MGDPSRENVRLGFYFADLIFVVCQSTAKTAKIGSLKNFRLYGNLLAIAGPNMLKMYLLMV